MGQLLLLALVIGIVSFLISRYVYNKVNSAGNKYALAWSIASFVAIFALIMGGLFIVFMLTFSR